MCIFTKTLAVSKRIVFVLTVTLVMPALAAPGEKPKQTSKETKADKTIEIKSSEIRTELNPNIIDVALPKLDIDPVSRKLRRSFLKEAQTFIDKRTVTDIRNRRSSGDKSSN